MLSFSRSLPLRTVIARAAFLTAVVLVAACGHNSQSVAPSALASDPSTYDGQSVTVTGTAKNPTTRQTRRGIATVYQLCDSACINVVQFGNASVSADTQVTVSGRFRASFLRQAMTNVLVVGGGTGGGMGSSGGEAAPSSSP